MSSVETRPVPVNILSWPKIRDLISQHKFIYVTLYFNRYTTACGCYLLGVDSLAAEMSMTAPSLDDALNEFKRRGLIELDKETGEIFVSDWPRWHHYKTPAALGALQASVDKIQSRRLGITVKTAYESTLQYWKGKDKAKDKVKASSDEEEGSAPRGGPKKPRFSRSGIQLWTAEDEQQSQLIESKYSIDDIRSAVGRLKQEGTEPFPSRISKLLAANSNKEILPHRWWESEPGTKTAAGTLGLKAHIGESMTAFRERIRSEFDRRQQELQGCS